MTYWINHLQSSNYLMSTVYYLGVALQREKNQTPITYDNVQLQKTHFMNIISLT